MSRAHRKWPTLTDKWRLDVARGRCPVRWGGFAARAPHRHIQPLAQRRRPGIYPSAPTGPPTAGENGIASGADGSADLDVASAPWASALSSASRTRSRSACQVDEVQNILRQGDPQREAIVLHDLASGGDERTGGTGSIRPLCKGNCKRKTLRAAPVAAFKGLPWRFGWLPPGCNRSRWDEIDKSNWPQWWAE